MNSHNGQSRAKKKQEQRCMYPRVISGNQLLSHPHCLQGEKEISLSLCLLLQVLNKDDMETEEVNLKVFALS